MKNLTKNLIKNNVLIMLLILGSFLTTNVMAQAPNHTFNYQGELMDGGIPANGSYDITISAFFGPAFGILQGVVSTHTAVDVVNGLFTLNNVDIGASTFDGFTFYLEVAVRPAGGGAYTALAPRQLLQAVPYANDITRKGAVSGQVLTFDGNSWEPAAGGGGSSPWTVTGTDVTYTGGEVGIGTASPAGANLHISASGTDNAIRVQVNGATKLYVRNDGGVAIGGSTSNVAPPDGLSVFGDVKQPIASNGIMKYMVHVSCDATPTIEKSYNGVNSGAITVVLGSAAGRCRINFPTDINDRYWQASAVYALDSGNAGQRNTTCRRGTTNNQLLCERYLTDTGALSSGSFMVLIY